MTYESFPNTGHNARAITLGEHERLVTPLGLPGLVGYNGALPAYADSTGRHVKIRDGVAGTIQGTNVTVTAEETVSVGANSSGSTRIDLLVLRLDRADYEIDPVVIAGTPAASPIAPTPVRNAPGGSPDYYDIPLAEITVLNGATTITATQVRNRAWWATGDGLLGFNTARPPVLPGVSFQEIDTGITRVGTVGGTWQTTYRYTDWVSVSAGSGWTVSAFAVARDGNMCTANVRVVRNGSAIGPTVSPRLGPIPAQFRPDRTVWGTYYASTPDRVRPVALGPDGRITFSHHPSHPIADGTLLVAALPAWIVDDVA